MFSGMRRSIGRGLSTASGLNMMTAPYSAMGAAIGLRRQGQPAPQGYIDDSLPAQSAADPNFTLKSVQQRRNQSRRPGMMSGMGGLLGGKF
jgi:hypothetical protein